MTLTLTSQAFRQNGEIPPQHTCQGADVSPPLAWSGVPANTKSLALIVDDPDAPDPAAPKMTWVHWVLYNIPPTAASQRTRRAIAPDPATVIFMQSSPARRRALWATACSLVGQSLVPRSLAPQSAGSGARFGSRVIPPGSSRPGGGRRG